MTTNMKSTTSRTMLQKGGHFLWHYLQMCIARCVGGVILSVAFFGGAALIGYPDLVAQAPALSTLVLAINVSVPMVAWMRFRHHEWRPTLEMASAPMGLGIVLIALGLLGLIPVSGMFELEASLACPVMLVPMLLRFNHYAGSMNHHAHAAS